MFNIGVNQTRHIVLKAEERLMEKLRKWVALTLLFTLVATSIQGQPTYIQQDDNTYSSAYEDSSRTAHWSAYVPIGIMVAAAIWFGVADTSNSDDSSSYGYYGYGSRSSTSSGSYSHHSH